MPGGSNNSNNGNGNGYDPYGNANAQQQAASNPYYQGAQALAVYNANGGNAVASPLLGNSGFTPSNPGSPFIDNMGSGQNFVSVPQFQPDGSSPFPFYNQMPTPPNFVEAPAQGASQSSSQDSLYNALLQQLMTPTQGVSTADLQKSAQQQAALKYDPLIRQLQQNLGSAQTNEGIASQKIGDLYGSLGRALAAQMPVVTNQFNQAEDQSRQNYATLQNQIQNNYQGAQQAQAAELQKLGIQAALPQSTEKLNRDQQYLTNQAGTNGQALNDAMRLMGQGQSDFMQRASAIAPTQGANIQSNLAQNLLQLQNQINGQIAGYKGDEASAAASLLAQMQSSQGALQERAQQAMDSNLASLMNNMMNNQTRENIAGNKTVNLKGIHAATDYLAQNSAPQDAAQLETILNDFQNSPQMAQLTGPGGIGSPTYYTQLPLLMQIAQQEDPQISNAQLQQLQNALAMMNGKY